MSISMIVYRVPIPAEIKEGVLWLDAEQIATLSLGINWIPYAQKYYRRSGFYWDLSISGHGEGALPVIDAKVELHVRSQTAPVFMLEIATLPTKLDLDQRSTLEKVIEDNLDNSEFKVWWENDHRGPRKRSAKVKRKILDKVKSLNKYDGSDDLKLEDIQVSIKEALSYFEFGNNASKEEIKEGFKPKLKKFQLKTHPDSVTGSEEDFLYLQKCKIEILTWLKR